MKVEAFDDTEVGLRYILLTWGAEAARGALWLLLRLKSTLQLLLVALSRSRLLRWLYMSLLLSLILSLLH